MSEEIQTLKARLRDSDMAWFPNHGVVNLYGDRSKAADVIEMLETKVANLERALEFSEQSSRESVAKTAELELLNEELESELARNKTQHQ